MGDHSTQIETDTGTYAVPAGRDLRSSRAGSW